MGVKHSINYLPRIQQDWNVFSPIGCAINDESYRFMTIWHVPCECPATLWRLPGSYTRPLKVAFFQKVRFVFQISKKITPNHYPELEIWISCLLWWAGISNFKFRIVIWSKSFLKIWRFEKRTSFSEKSHLFLDCPYWNFDRGSFSLWSPPKF